MRPRIVLPVRPFAEGKTRLAAALSAAQRETLNRAFFMHVLGVAIDSVPPRHCHVISRSDEVLEAAIAAGANAIREQGTCLNAALAQAATLLAAENDAPIMAVSSDLPFVTVADIAAMIAAGDDADVVAACDLARSGTNALLQRRPGLIAYHYGRDSIAAHRTAAKAAGASFVTVERPGLAEDIDTPDQLKAMRERAY